MKVVVSLPQTEEPDKGGKFTSYLVSYSSKAGEGSVRRRYSDFQWLYKRLQTECPGSIVPVIPHARAIGRKFDDDFIEERRRQLQVFIKGVVEHDELSRTPSLTPFMVEALGPDFDAAKTKVEHAKPTNHADLDKLGEEIYLGGNDAEEGPGLAGGAGKRIGALFAKIRVSVGSKELLSTANEPEVVALQEYIAQAAKQANKLAKASDALVRCTLETANIYGEMGPPLDEWKTAYTTTLQQKEEKGGMLDSISCLSEFTNDFSLLLRQKHLEEEEKFSNTLHRLCNSLKAYQIALKQRKNWQLTYTATTKQIIDKEAAFAKAQKNMKPPEVTEKNCHEKAELEKRSEAEKKTFEDCTNRLLRDAEVYKPQVETLLKSAFVHYAQIQLAYSDRIHQAFGQLMPYLGSVPVNQQPEVHAVPVNSSPPDAPPPPLPIGDDDIVSELDIDAKSKTVFL